MGKISCLPATKPFDASTAAALPHVPGPASVGLRLPVPISSLFQYCPGNATPASLPRPYGVQQFIALLPVLTSAPAFINASAPSYRYLQTDLILVLAEVQLGVLAAFADTRPMNLPRK